MIREYKEYMPTIGEGTFVAETAVIIGDVRIGKNCSIWYGTVMRGDFSEIVVGDNTNIQENAVLHGDVDYKTIVGSNVTIGHGAIIHGCEIAQNVLIGMGAILLNGAKIGKNSIVGAGSLITQNKEFEEGMLILGNPAKAVRKLSEEEIESIQKSADHYAEVSEGFKA